MKKLPLLALCFSILCSSAALAGPLRDRFLKDNSESNLSLRDNSQKMEMLSLNHGGLERSYGLFVPNRVARSRERAPLVIMLHGGGGFARAVGSEVAGHVWRGVGRGRDGQGPWAAGAVAASRR